jgi:hypothetical protein
MCELYILRKMTNVIWKQLSLHKSKRLELIQFDIPGPLPQSVHSNHNIIPIIESYTPVDWLILVKHYCNRIVLLRSWNCTSEVMESRNGATDRTQDYLCEN